MIRNICIITSVLPSDLRKGLFESFKNEILQYEYEPDNVNLDHITVLYDLLPCIDDQARYESGVNEYLAILLNSHAFTHFLQNRSPYIQNYFKRTWLKTARYIRLLPDEAARLGPDVKYKVNIIETLAPFCDKVPLLNFMNDASDTLIQEIPVNLRNDADIAIKALYMEFITANVEDTDEVRNAFTARLATLRETFVPVEPVFIEAPRPRTRRLRNQPHNRAHEGRFYASEVHGEEFSEQRQKGFKSIVKHYRKNGQYQRFDAEKHTMISLSESEIREEISKFILAEQKNRTQHFNPAVDALIKAKAPRLIRAFWKHPGIRQRIIAAAKKDKTLETWFIQGAEQIVAQNLSNDEEFIPWYFEAKNDPHSPVHRWYKSRDTKHPAVDIEAPLPPSPDPGESWENLFDWADGVQFFVDHNLHTTKNVSSFGKLNEPVTAFDDCTPLQGLYLAWCAVHDTENLLPEIFSGDLVTAAKRELLHHMGSNQAAYDTNDEHTHVSCPKGAVERALDALKIFHRFFHPEIKVQPKVTSPSNTNVQPNANVQPEIKGIDINPNDIDTYLKNATRDCARQLLRDSNTSLEVIQSCYNSETQVWALSHRAWMLIQEKAIAAVKRECTIEDKVPSAKTLAIIQRKAQEYSLDTECLILDALLLDFTENEINTSLKKAMRHAAHQLLLDSKTSLEIINSCRDQKTQRWLLSHDVWVLIKDTVIATIQKQCAMTHERGPTPETLEIIRKKTEAYSQDAKRLILEPVVLEFTDPEKTKLLNRVSASVGAVVGTAYPNSRREPPADPRASSSARATSSSLRSMQYTG